MIEYTKDFCYEIKVQICFYMCRFFSGSQWFQWRTLEGFWYKDCLSNVGISFQIWDGLIFMIGILIPGKMVLILKQTAVDLWSTIHFTQRGMGLFQYKNCFSGTGKMVSLYWNGWQVKLTCVCEVDGHWVRSVVCSEPSHCPNQCWFIVNWTLWSKLQWNLNENTKLFFQENAFESVVCKM